MIWNYVYCLIYIATAQLYDMELCQLSDLHCQKLVFSEIEIQLKHLWNLVLVGNTHEIPLEYTDPWNSLKCHKVTFLIIPIFCQQTESF